MVAGLQPGAKLLAVLLSLVVLQRLLELRLARRNERWARGVGAREYGSRHYPLFFLLHGGWLAGWVTESVSGGVVLSPAWPLWLALFGVAEAVRYWAIAGLGRRWNTRILVHDGLPPVRRGPYRFVSHPNYWAVALELLSLPLVFGATYTAVVATLLNAALLLGVRIPAERHALHAAALRPGSPQAGVVENVSR